MREKLTHFIKARTVGKIFAGLYHALFLSLVFAAISGLSGCSVPQYMNDKIASAVGDSRLKLGTKARTTEGQVYNCRVRSITGLERSGMMEESARTKALFTTKSMSFIYDETTGILSGDGFLPLKMTILQKGTNENSAIGYSKYEGSASSGIAVLQIRKWEVGLPFLFLDSSDLWTGTCETK
jgi:hypothetical protein